MPRILLSSIAVTIERGQRRNVGFVISTRSWIDHSKPDSGSGDGREFGPVLGEPRNSMHFWRVQNRDHERVIGYVPFARDSELPGRAEPESWIEVRMPDDDDEWVSRLLEFPVARFNELAPDTLALVCGQHRHRTQAR